MNKKNILFIIIPFLLLVIIFWLYFYFQNNKTDENNTIVNTSELTSIDSQASIYPEIKLTSEEKISTHSQEDNSQITQEIADIINLTTYHGNCGIYIKNLETGEEITINEDVDFYPASIYKLPLAILILKKIEDEELSLSDKFVVQSEDIAYNYDPLASYVGREVELSTILQLLIENSDNTAQRLLVNHVIGSYEEYNLQIKNILGLNSFQGDFESLTTTPRQVGQLLENIYNIKYLNSKYNSYLIDLLSNTSENFNDRIVAGVPNDITVAHKIGQLDDIYQDAGIVYGNYPYIIVFLNEKILSYDVASSKIIQISNLVWNYFND